MLKTRLPSDFIVTKINLNNYDNLFDLRKYIHNVKSDLEWVIHDTNIMCKTLPTTFNIYAYSSLVPQFRTKLYT